MFGTIVEINLAKNDWSKDQISVQPEYADTGKIGVLTISRGTVILLQTAGDKAGAEITVKDLKVGDMVNVAMSGSGNEAALIKVMPRQQSASLSEKERADSDLHTRAMAHSRATGLPYGQAVKAVAREFPGLAMAHYRGRK